MWTPTHVQVTVHRARNLLPKGKGGKNDAYVTIQLAKEKYQTSVRDKVENPEWHEECDLPIPESDGIIHLNVYHRSFLGLDDFLGHVALPLSQFQVYERPKSRWYALRCKPGKKGDNKYRGEIEVKLTFIVQSKSSSQLSLNKTKIRRAGSIKNLANTMGEKLKLPVRSSSFKSDRKLEEKKPPAAIIEPLVPESQLSTSFSTPPSSVADSSAASDSSATITDTDDFDLRSSKETDCFVRGQPGSRVPLKRTVSDADARFVLRGRNGDSGELSETPLLDTKEMTRSLGKLPDEADLANNYWDSNKKSVHISSLGEKYRSTMGSSIPESIPEDNEELTKSSDETRLRSKQERNNLHKLRDPSRRHTLQGGISEIPGLPAHQLNLAFPGQPKTPSIIKSLAPGEAEKYKDMDREELMVQVENLKKQHQSQNAYIRDLENYIDNLLVRVMETTPKLLQNPYDKQHQDVIIKQQPVQQQQQQQPRIIFNKKKTIPNPLRRLQKSLK